MGDAATGYEKQEEAAESWAAERGHEIVATADDTNVSGSRNPFTRPKLGPYLADPSSYDGIIAAKLDRFGRNARHLQELRSWATDQGKKLIVVEPALQWPVPEGVGGMPSRVMWELLGILAESELAAITERNRETVTWLNQNDYLTGKRPFGYLIVPHPDNDKHKTLEPDPELRPVLEELVNRKLGGASLTALCEYLDEVAPKDGGVLWATTSVVQILRNPILYGRRKAYLPGTKTPKGRTLLKVPPVVDYATWKRLQRNLDDNKKRRGPSPEDPALLKGVAECGKCGGPLYFFESVGPTRKDGTRARYTYYRCAGRGRQSSPCKGMVPSGQLEQWTSDWFAPYAPLGSLPLVERTVIPGSGHEHEIEQVGQDMQELTARFASGGIGDAEYDRDLSSLRAELSRLRGLPDEPDQVEEHPTGVTVAEHWRELDTVGRREFLLSAGLTVRAQKVKHRGQSRLFAKLVPTDLDAFESTMRYGKRGVKSAEPWKRKGARLVVPAG